MPWAQDPTSKTTADYLLDIFCDMPGVLGDMSALDGLSSSTDRPLPYVTLAFRIKALLEALFTWRARWEKDYAITYFHVGREALKALRVAHLDYYPFATAIFFTEPVRVTELCMYNALLILLQRAWEHLPASIRPASPCSDGMHVWSQPSILLAPGNGSVKDAASELCRLVYYQLVSHPGNSGAIFIMFPLQVAYRSVDADSPQRQWLSKLARHIADGYGFHAAKYSEEVGEAGVLV